MEEAFLMTTMRATLRFLEAGDIHSATLLLQGVLRIIRETEEKVDNLREVCSGDRSSCGVPNCVECRNYLTS